MFKPFVVALCTNGGQCRTARKVNKSAWVYTGEQKEKRERERYVCEERGKQEADRGSEK